jgi:hypothetical protein
VVRLDRSLTLGRALGISRHTVYLGALLRDNGSLSTTGPDGLAVYEQPGDRRNIVQCSELSCKGDARVLNQGLGWIC